jgi:hypothetical protein
MLQFKRFMILIYIHLILSVFLTYLNTVVVIKLDFIDENWLKALFSLGCTSFIFLIIGLFWGSLATEKKNPSLPLVLYVIILVGLFIASFFTETGWLVFINGNIPFTYFIRNIDRRDLLILIIYALSCVVPSYILYEGFQLSYRLTHRKEKIIETK